MAYQALYRKYRPNTFDDFIDQDSVKKILVNSIKNNKISHAYLFAGPRGIGKTSMAKIFAKAINCLDFNRKSDVCNECANCVEADNQPVDIIEIDAASNNGVDQIRELKNKVSIVPSNLKYKVYIIDEVHMLTNSAFNALLKTLEEPPSYVVFILATTEFYEVPETIVSRCQCFSFGRITITSMEKRLREISNKENISITDDAISEIAHYANGGLRDAIGLLDKLRSFTNEEITIDVFKNIQGIISQEEVNKFYVDIFNKDVNGILDLIDKINTNGYDFKNFIERLMLLIRDKIVDYYKNKTEILGNINDNVELISVLNEILNRLKDAIDGMVIVQVYLLKYLENSDKNISQEIKLPENEPVNSIKITEKKETNENIDVNNVDINTFIVNEEVKNIRINNAMATADLKYKKELAELWKDVNKYFMDDKYGKIAQLLSDTEPMVVGDKYAILTTQSMGIIDNLYNNLTGLEKFITKLYHKLAIVLLTDDEFNIIKQKYIEDRKNNVVYEVQKETGKLIIEQNNLINQAISVFGSDIVDIE